MKEIAWIGSRQNFYKNFHTNKNVYADRNAQITYINIAEPRDLVGRRFDDIYPEYDNLEFDYYTELYKETKKRFKKGE